MIKLQDNCDFEPATAPEAYLQQEIKKLQSQVEQLQAELASATASKEPKLPEWNDKEAEWQSYPPGATIVMPLPPAAGKVTIVKEKFYPADKELIDQLQAEKEGLQSAARFWNDRANELEAENAELNKRIAELENKV